MSEHAERAGGKGVNVARVLRALGEEVTVTGLAGGLTGSLVRDEIAAAGLVDRLVTIAGESRRTVTVVDRGGTDGATAFNEAGPRVTPSEWQAFLTLYAQQAARADAVVLSGSLPPGVPGDAYGQLVAGARAAAGDGGKRRGVHVVLDADGDALLAGIAAGPDVVKPNVEELTRATGIEEPVPAARALGSRMPGASGGGAGAGAVVASLGPGGLIALTPEGEWRARPPSVFAGNPTGAGDALVAALVHGAVRAIPWPERLRHAVALSAAAVRAPLAGDVAADWRTAVGGVRVEAL